LVTLRTVITERRSLHCPKGRLVLRSSGRSLHNDGLVQPPDGIVIIRPADPSGLSTCYLSMTICTSIHPSIHPYTHTHNTFARPLAITPGPFSSSLLCLW
jgi:hypothetical protein